MLCKLVFSAPVAVAATLLKLLTALEASDKALESSEAARLVADANPELPNDNPDEIAPPA